jgi:hypothetical protein
MKLLKLLLSWFYFFSNDYFKQYHRDFPDSIRISSVSSLDSLKRDERDDLVKLCIKKSKISTLENIFCISPDTNKFVITFVCTMDIGNKLP